jgi:hypothetical protein
MRRDAYSISELKTMVAMLDRGERFPAIAAALGRSQHSVRVKASKLRLHRQREAVLSAAVRTAERDALRMQAEFRGQNIDELLARLVTVIVADDLFAAILDDAP